MCWSLFAVLAVVTVVNGHRETCLSTEKDPYLYFGTKTSYIHANKGIQSYRNRPHDVPSCQPIAFWLLNRHGSHNPEADETNGLQKLVDLKNDIVNNYKSGKNIATSVNYKNAITTNFNEQICQLDLDLLGKWKWIPSQNLSFAGDLTSDGYFTTQHLAQVWKQRFPRLLTGNHSDYLFKFVNDKRSGNTFRAFTEGLFGVRAEGLNIPKENDAMLLRPYKFCRAWTRDVEENKDTLSQANVFESKQEFQEMMTNISHRLGFHDDLHKEVILTIYQMCRYNKAWDFGQTSPWCVAFTKEDLKRLEFAEDLETYYKYGYGSPVNQKIGYFFVKDMMNFFAKHVENDSPQRPRSMIHFTEAPMLLMTLAAMGVHRDSAPLTGDNYHPNLAQSRKWSSSSMAPFNANLAAVLYKCTTLNGNVMVKEQHQVLFLENEKPMALEGCREGLCEWSNVKNRFEKIDSDCNSASKISRLFGLSIALLASIGRLVLLED